MSKNIGFVALGQGGGNIGMLLEKRGYTVLFMNTSQEDLDTLKDVKHSYHITNGEGCNKDRDKSKSLIIEDFDNIAKQIEDKVKEDYIYVIFSAGGGTGSGGAPMLMDMLIQHTGRRVGAITILPAKNEPLKTFINSYECFKELENVEGTCATFILDNNRLERTLINSTFCNLFDSFLGSSQHVHASGNIDKAEVFEMLGAHGSAVICNTTDTEATTANAIKSFEQNIFAPIENDRVIRYIGISSTSPLNIEDVTKTVGVPLDIFQGTNPKETLVMLCGLSYPYGALEEIRKMVAENQDMITKNLTATQETKLAEGINFLNDIPAGKSKAPDKKIVDKSSIFAKYKK